MELSRPVFKTKDLSAGFFGGRGSSSTPPAADPKSVPVASRVVGDSSALVASSCAEVQQSPVVAAMDGPPLEKRFKSGDHDKGVWQSPRDKAPPEKRSRVDTTVELTPGPISVPSPLEPAPWKPELQTEPGEALNVENWVASNPLVIAALSKACAFPCDMERHRKADDVGLLLSLLQASILNVQRIQVVLDRNQQNVSMVSRLELEKKELGTTLEESEKKLKRSEEMNVGLVAEVDTAVAEICRLKTSSHTMNEMFVYYDEQRKG